MNTIDPADVAILLPHARKYASQLGPMFSASDDSIGGLAAAQANSELLRPGWCQCQDPTGPAIEEVYFQRPDGSHGWMCGHCRKLTQAG